MKKIKKFLCLLLVVCFSVTTFPHVFASAAETSSACPFELGDTIMFKTNDHYIVADNKLLARNQLYFSSEAAPIAQFEVIKTFDDGSFCLGYNFCGDYNVYATIDGLTSGHFKDATKFVLDDAGNSQYYLKVNSGDSAGKYVNQLKNGEMGSRNLRIDDNNKVPLTISKNSKQM